VSLAINKMFDGIAPTYDALNRIMSLGVDRGWRKRAVARLGDIRGKRVLDICAGTLDLSLIAADAGAWVMAADFAQEMLERGKRKLGRDPAPIFLFRADAQHLPFADGVFAGATCGFGLRNLDDPLAGLREARRVLAPGAKLVILDLFRPRRRITRAIQVLYNRRVLPFIGGLISGERDAYRYLAQSIERFATPEEIADLAREAGFATVEIEDLTAGIASLVVCS
jgi:ubiquinone/menaquinone biosynthesis methyltransferase